MYPFVHRLKTEENSYLYDVHSGAIVQVGDVVYEIIDAYDESEERQLAERFGNRFGTNEMQEAFASIRQARETHDLFRADAPKRRYVELDRNALNHHLQTGLEAITLGITEECNLRCSYCVYSGRFSERRTHARKEMPFSVASKAIEYLRLHGQGDQGPVSIGFYGGEPFLRWKFVKKVCEHARRDLGEDQLGFTITTNGTILSDQILDFLEEYNFSLVVSLDGPRDYHDTRRRFKNGRGSWNRVIKNLERIGKRYPQMLHDRVLVNAVLSPPANLSHLDEFFGNLPMRLRLTLVETDSPGDYQSWRFFSEYDRIREKFKTAAIGGQLNDLEDYPKNRFVNSVFGSPMRRLHLRNIPPLQLGLPRMHGLCIPGTSKLFIGADGTCYPCERLEGYERMKIGHISQGVDVELTKRLIDDYTNLDWNRCTRCWIRGFCSYCFVHPFSQGSFNETKLDMLCELRRRHFHEMLITYCSILEQNAIAFDFMVADEYCGA